MVAPLIWLQMVEGEAFIGPPPGGIVDAITDEFEPVLFKDAPGTEIELENFGAEAGQFELVKPQFDRSANGSRRESTPPEGTSNPVSELAAIIGPDAMNAADTDEQTGLENGKRKGLAESLLAKTLVDELLRAVLGIRHGETGGWSEVGMTHQTLHGNGVSLVEWFQPDVTEFLHRHGRIR
jgi:hypothetical protein